MSSIPDAPGWLRRVLAALAMIVGLDATVLREGAIAGGQWGAVDGPACIPDIVGSYFHFDPARGELCNLTVSQHGDSVAVKFDCVNGQVVDPTDCSELRGGFKTWRVVSAAGETRRGACRVDLEVSDAGLFVFQPLGDCVIDSGEYRRGAVHGVFLNDPTAACDIGRFGVQCAISNHSERVMEVVVSIKAFCRNGVKRHYPLRRKLSAGEIRVETFGLEGNDVAAACDEPWAIDLRLWK